MLTFLVEESSLSFGVRQDKESEPVFEFTIEQLADLRLFWDIDDPLMMSSDGEMVFERSEEGIIIRSWEKDWHLFLGWNDARKFFIFADQWRQ